MLKHGEVTEQILQGFYRVYRALGYGFLEKVYENALALELRNRGLSVQQQAPVKVFDLLVEGCVIVELKAAEALVDEHFAQLINYLKATGVEVGLLLNFGPKPEVKRKIFELAKREGSFTRNQDSEVPWASVRVRSPRAILDLEG